MLAADFLGNAPQAASGAAAAMPADPESKAAAPMLPPVEDLPVVQRPMTPLMSSKLKALLADLLNKGLPEVTANGQAAGIFDVDLSVAVPHYNEIVPEPMDLGTMKKKLQRQEYPNAGEFEKDFRRLLVACSQYNIRTQEHPGYADGQYYLKLAAVLQTEFETRFANTMEVMQGEMARASAPAAAAPAAATTDPGSAAAPSGAPVNRKRSGPEGAELDQRWQVRFERTFTSRLHHFCITLLTFFVTFCSLFRRQRRLLQRRRSRKLQQKTSSCRFTLDPFGVKTTSLMRHRSCLGTTQAKYRLLVIYWDVRLFEI